VDGFRAIFAERLKHVKALVADVADKVIGGHIPILTESGVRKKEAAEAQSRREFFFSESLCLSG
jgi:hypothetical protein